MPEDAKEAIGHGIRAKRSKSGAVSFELSRERSGARSAASLVHRSSDEVGWWKQAGIDPLGFCTKALAGYPCAATISCREVPCSVTPVSRAPTRHLFADHFLVLPNHPNPNRQDRKALLRRLAISRTPSASSARLKRLFQSGRRIV
jgi:hypothetical protein